MSSAAIASRANPLFKQLRALGPSSRRQRAERCAWLEGPHLLSALLDAGWTPGQWAVAAGAVGGDEIAALLARGRAAGARIAVFDDALFAQLTQAAEGAGILAVAPLPEREIAAAIESDCVILDGVQDAGNAGAILRTAAAAGVRLALCTPGTANLWSGKVLRAGMGAHFVMHVAAESDSAEIAARLRVPLAATTLEQAESLYALDLRGPLAWVFGNEGAGVGAQWLALARYRVRIPQTEGVESLNVAAAAAVCLFEQRRQRLA